MARRKKKLISIRKPKLRITSKGVKVTKPSARIGGKAGVNISSKGVSASVRTKHGTVSTRKGRSGCACCPLMLLGIFAAFSGTIAGVGYILAMLL